MPSRASDITRLSAYGLTALLALTIAYLTLMPVQAPPGLPGNDKMFHFVGFAALVMPMAALHPRGLFILLPLAVVFGASIELIQPSVGRERELADFFADALGAVAGGVLGLVGLHWPLRKMLTFRNG